MKDKFQNSQTKATEYVEKTVADTSVIFEERMNIRLQIRKIFFGNQNVNHYSQTGCRKISGPVHFYADGGDALRDMACSGLAGSISDMGHLMMYQQGDLHWFGSGIGGLANVRSLGSSHAVAIVADGYFNNHELFHAFGAAHHDNYFDYQGNINKICSFVKGLLGRPFMGKDTPPLVYKSFNIGYKPHQNKDGCKWNCNCHSSQTGCRSENKCVKYTWTPATKKGPNKCVLWMRAPPGHKPHKHTPHTHKPHRHTPHNHHAQKPHGWNCRMTLAGGRASLKKNPLKCSPTSEKHSVRCCRKSGDPRVMMDKYGCNAGRTFEGAQRICSAKSLRLCTEAEIKGGKAEGTGCGYDEHRVWTSSKKCRMTLAGGRGSLKKIPPKCSWTSEKHSVRCCRKNGDPRVMMDKYGCNAGRTWEGAQRICSTKSLRLCTEAEIKGGKAEVTGCDYDEHRVWTSSKAP